MHPGRGPKPHKYISKKGPAPWQVFYDEDDVWHFCSREEDSTCADQYSLPTTLRRRFQATNPEEWTCLTSLTQEMEVLVQMMFPYELGDF